MSLMLHRHFRRVGKVTPCPPINQCVTLTQNAKGFTLIELMVALLLIALIATYAIPSLREVQTRHTRENDIHGILTALRYARKQSVLQGADLEVCPVGTNSLCSEDWHQGLQVQKGNRILRRFPPLSPRSQLTWRGMAGETRIRFTASLIAKNSNGHFDYIPAGETTISDQIILNRAGHIRRQRVK